MTTSAPLTGLRFLRPYLSKDLQITHKSTYIRFFNSTCRSYRKRHVADENVGFRGDVAGRVELLRKANGLKWPRIKSSIHSISGEEFHKKYKDMAIGQTIRGEAVLLRGRVKSIRTSGQGLMFMDLISDGLLVQAVCDLSKLEAFSGVDKKMFKHFQRILQTGDIISCCGDPYTSKSGTTSIRVTELPLILSPSLAILPSKLEDKETRIRNRHVDMLVNSEVVHTMKLRSHIVQYIRDFLIKDKFLEVQTPIIADKAGGAVARPFTTVATEFTNKQLALRIAPEIWLKRLVIGGMERVFEIGQVFRNEGLDQTHNAEFTTCEFYKAFADLDDLMDMTEKMFSGIAAAVDQERETSLYKVPSHGVDLTLPFQRIEFIPTIEKALGEVLPDLEAEDSTQQLIKLFEKSSLPIPVSPTLPRLLDKLASIYIEPHCTNPTYITHHPACMAPLSKSFLCPTTDQMVSARAELFIQNREIANMYEEENSPFEQRAKFVQQLKFQDDENKADVDESYLEALEWGLPPTGGWGAGIDRIVMLFSGSKRIADVLTFGNLRNVVNLSTMTPTRSTEKKAEELTTLKSKQMADGEVKKGTKEESKTGDYL